MAKSKGDKKKDAKDKKETRPKEQRVEVPTSAALRVGPDFSWDDVDERATPGWDGDKAAAAVHLDARADELSDLQERLYAHGRTGGDRSVLLVLQGMDTAGKGGIVRHVLGLVDPQGVALRSFGVPTPEELRHHYLWRVRRALPRPGQIGVFDRSHYEDVLVTRVRGLVDEAEVPARFEEINRFERKLVESGTTIIKVAMAVSYDEQGARLRERLERPEKHWKYNPGDIDARVEWPEYRRVYAEAIRATSTEHAPWHLVPADRKWFARLAVGELLLEALRGLELAWPTADFDVAHELERLSASDDLPH